jgi:transposase-like protein
MSEKEAQLHPVIAVRVKPDLYAWADEQAAIEGISRSDVARRALIRDRQRQLAEERGRLMSISLASLGSGARTATGTKGVR